MKKITIRSRWQEDSTATAKQNAKMAADAANWQVAMDFLIEKQMLKEFLLWEAKRSGASDFAYAAMERATDKIAYNPSNG